MQKVKKCGCGGASCEPQKHTHIFNANFLLIAITTTVTYSFYMVCAVAFLA